MSTEIPLGYCHCGCGQKTFVPTVTNTPMGIFAGIPNKYILGHNARLQKRTSGIGRIFNHVTIFPGDDCIYWIGSNGGRTKHGVIRHLGRHVKVHRLIFEHAVGPIPPETDVHHKCDHENCVNPSHLELAPHGDHSAHHKRISWGKRKENM